MIGSGEALAAWRNECRNLRQAEIDALLSRGIPPLALARDPGTWSYGFAIRGARVVERPDLGLFDFCPDDPATQRALIIPLRDEWGEVADLLAWFPREDRAALWADAVCLAGQQEITAAAGAQEPVHVHPSILEWLRAGRSGVVILDPVRAAALLHGVTLAAPSAAIGHSLASLLTLRPRIVVPVAEPRRAA